jgi:hypothetical protein
LPKHESQEAPLFKSSRGPLGELDTNAITPGGIAEMLRRRSLEAGLSRGNLLSVQAIRSLAIRLAIDRGETAGSIQERMGFATREAVLAYQR